MSVSTQLRADAKNLPDKCGVYLFKDGRGTVLYVGKAKSLRARVRSYFAKNQRLAKAGRLVGEAAKVDYYVTGSEVEALVLESNLIKEYRPKYNVSFRDDKSYPYLAVCFDEEWPRVRYTREKHRGGTRYFGPYTNAAAVKDTLDALLKIFPLRTCSDTIYARAKNTDRPCLYFHINRCPGPCVGRADPAGYGRTVERICAFLEGRQEQVIADLTREMKEAAAKMEFERAAAFRDRIASAGRILEKQRVTTDHRLNMDIFGVVLEEDLGCVQLLKVRSGKLVGSEDYIVDLAAADDEKETLTGFIKQYYDRLTVFPDEIILPLALDEPEAIAAWLSDRRSRRLKLAVPGRGLKRRLVEMAAENAAHALERFKLRTAHEEKTLAQALRGLKEALRLKTAPGVIECFDISNIGGTEAVGSMVVFVGGRPTPKLYRRFKVRLTGEPNDFAMMKEVLTRRLARAGDAKFAHAPDLIIVDGGKPQLKAAQEALSATDTAGPAVAALAKKEEEFFLPGRADPVRLPARSPALYLVQRVRDEAHRFAVEYHRALRSKSMRASALDNIPGVGPERRKLLLKKFGSVKRVRQAAEAELTAAGIPVSVAKTIKKHLH